jgi:D-alanyl-D-alanine carboxypeptidase/D-alanyl-D-alanine-endopeptidase (penicillin-binding protein 4)
MLRALVGALALTAAATAGAARLAGATQAAPAPGPTRPASVSPSHLLRLQDDILTLTRSPGVERAVWGIVVQSLDRAERLVEVNPRTLLVPASAAKLLAVANAADAVGWDFRFATELRTAGTVVRGVLRGDLIVVGSGDPSIGGRGGSDLEEWITAVQGAGIERIDGRVIGIDDALEEPRPGLTWAWDDLGTSGTLYGALNFQENRLPVTVWPGLAAGDPAFIVPDPLTIERPLINLVTTGEVGSRALLWTEQRPGEEALSIAGTLPLRSGPVQMAVSAGNPTLWFARNLRHHLIEHGLAVRGAAVDADDLDEPIDMTATGLVYTHQSAPLRELASPILKDSINIYAEAALRLGAPVETRTNDKALEALRARLSGWGIPPDGQQVVDGSGLSRRNVVAAETLVGVLARFYEPAGTSPWMTALPVAGTDGTLQNRMRGTAAQGNLRAKTGSMSNIRTLAGYVTTADGERLAFAVLVNNFEGTGAVAVQAIDAIAVRLASFSRE